MAAVERFSWDELSRVPETSGIYAWYYAPILTAFDLNEVIENLRHLVQQSKIIEANLLLRDFFERRLLSFFQESPYQVRVSGALKASYEGMIDHKFSLSDQLLTRIREEPERLLDLKQVLEISAPHFASPLYIGMSDTLRSRIGQHRNLIERYRSEQSTQPNLDDLPEAGFARQVVNRRIPPQRLFVAICAIEAVRGIAVDAEHILNRIYYPILGRN